VRVGCEGDLAETGDGLGLGTGVLGTGGVWRNGGSFQGKVAKATGGNAEKVCLAEQGNVVVLLIQLR
jgi:hypothetical protein